MFITYRNLYLADTPTMDLDLDSDSEHEGEINYVDYTLINHVVFPRSLPQELADDFCSTESKIMDHMVNMIMASKEWLPRKTVKLFQNLKNIHNNCTPDNILNAIKKLRPGDTFAMFIQFQHFGIVVDVQSNETVNNEQCVIVSTMPGRLDASEIYSHESGIEVSFN